MIMAHARSYFLFPSNSLEIVLLVILYICHYAFQLTYWVGALLNIPNIRQLKPLN